MVQCWRPKVAMRSNILELLHNRSGVGVASIVMPQLRITRLLCKVASAQLHVQSAMAALVWLGELEPNDRIDDSLHAGANSIHDARVAIISILIDGKLGRWPVATSFEAAIPRDRSEARSAVEPGVPAQLQRRPAK